jgi:polygalacturonase
MAFDPDAQEMAGAALVAARGDISGALAANTAAINAIAIQAALDRGGEVKLLTPGVFLSNPLTVRSDTVLTLGPSTILRAASGVAGPFIRNANWNSPVVSVSSITAVADSTRLYRYVVTVATATAHGFAVGGYALVKGDTTEQYIGVHRVIAVPSDTSFQFVLTSRNGSIDGAGTMTVAKADRNITLQGGEVDANLNIGGTLSTMGVVFNKVGNLTLRDQLGSNAAKYMYYVGSAYGFYASNVTLRTLSDGIHLMGPCRNVVIDGVTGTTGDDFVAYTATNGGGYEAFDLPDCNGGAYQFFGV